MNIYIARVQELLTDLKELLRNSDVPDKDAAARVLKHDIIKAFVRGLQPKYLIHFTTKSFTDLASAFAEGRRVEQELSEFPQLHFKVRDCYAMQTNEVTEYKPEPSTERPYCTFCSRPGHVFDNCFKRRAQLEGRETTRSQRFQPESFTAPSYNTF
ncbi:hypothetical protein PV325_013559, partial [Microctonus aethiopoides]